MTAEINKPELRVGGTPSTWKKRGLISGASLIGSAVPSIQEGFMNELDEGELRGLPMSTQNRRRHLILLFILKFVPTAIGEDVGTFWGHLFSVRAGAINPRAG